MLHTGDTASEAEPLDQGILHGLLGRELRVTYLALLVIVERNPGARQTLIAKARGLDKSTLVPMIDRLERDGLLERRPLASDRRIRAIWITDHGKAVLKQAIPIVQKSDDLLRTHLSDGELSELLRLMQKVRDGLAEKAAS